RAYFLGSWPAPFGIVLVLDRLSATMLLLTAVLASAVVVYAAHGWDERGHHFHPLFHFQLMGINGAFLTGDVFNLFVFFEILLAASYGLVLRGLGSQRVKTGLNYIAVNLASSSLFLVGVALIYGITGTLNMADLTQRIPALAAADRAIFDAGVALLGVAFLVKAGSWPLNFWLPRTYSIAVPPVAAIFAIMTKVGVYAVLRVGTLVGEDRVAAAILGGILFYTGFATLLAGIVGMLSARHLGRFVAYSVVVSTGLLLAALGLGLEELTAPALFYLVTSVLTTAAFFMLTGMAERARLTHPHPESGERAPAPYYVAFGVAAPDPYGLDEEVGTAIPAAMAFLGLVFVVCVLLVAGLPPLPGFIAKFALLSAALGSTAANQAPVWLFTFAVLLSGFVAIFAASRIGIRLFWSRAARRVPRIRALEAAPVASLVLVTFALSAASPDVIQFLRMAATSLLQPEAYVNAVMSAGGGAP
ncbi:MAG TPA: monovalent cation/H+ antiporter subunit D, partial [Woeseiaceae bacterium]|nr:monovalent cation/H+ antiporter subunit D [Woeseiaceae bacterium]